MRSHRRARAGAPASLAACACGIALACGTALACGIALGASAIVAGLTGLAMPAGAAGAATGHAKLTLDGQTPWVTPPTSGSAAPFTLALSAGGATPGAQVQVALYPRLSARDHFVQDVQHGPRGTPLSQSSPVPLSQLPADPQRAGGEDLGLQIVTSAATGGQTLGLGCTGPTTTGTTTCTGVYPMSVALLGASGVREGHFTTFLTYSAGKSASPLDFSLVLPLSSPVSLAPHGTAATAVAPLGRSGAATLEQAIAAVHAASAVPVTLEASPETLRALASSGAAGRAAVTTLDALSANQSVDQVPAAPYVPINLASLAGAGESTELYAQMAAGQTVLRKLHVGTSAALPWVATGPVGNDMAPGLSRVGATDVVVPQSSLASTPNAPPDTWASTFRLSMGPGSRTAIPAAESDTFLTSQFRSVSADPALSAVQVLADLAMVHFELPNTVAVRGMVAVPPIGWNANPVFLRTLLAGLSGNPVVTPVTLSRFFSAVTPAGTRTLQPGRSQPALSRPVARALSSARVRLTEFGQSVLGKPPVLGQLDHALLATESDRLTARSRLGAVRLVEHLLSDQLQLVTFSSDHSYTLTARTGVIPITLESKAPYTVVGTLVVSGARFVFPNQTTSVRHAMTLTHAINPWRVRVEAHSSGDLPLQVSFVSPSGRLVIAQGELTVRSTATSLVGVVLTILALAVLLAWWARTWRGRRRKRRAGSDPLDEPEHVGAGVP